MSLHTLSNQERHTEAVLCAGGRSEQDPPVLVPTPAMVGQRNIAIYCYLWRLVLPNGQSDEKCLKERKENCHGKKIRRESCNCGDVEKMETAHCKTDRKLTKTLPAELAALFGCIS